tara:strand:- start:1178 stop:1402 length:225 start_codon:yes stop_codon:yes gene_type:complete
MNRFYKALEIKYEAKIAEAIATLDLYFRNSVGIGEHPDILEVLDNYMSVLDENQSKLDALRYLFKDSDTSTEDK